MVIAPVPADSGVALQGQPDLALRVAVALGGDAGEGVVAFHAVPGGVTGIALLLAHPADGGVPALKHHGLGGVALQNVPHLNLQGAVKPHLHHLAIPGQELRQPGSVDAVVFPLEGRVPGDALLAHIHYHGVRRQVDAQFDAGLLAGGGQVTHHVPLAVFIGDLLHAKLPVLCLPGAEAQGVLGHKHQVFGPQVQGGLHPLVRVQAVAGAAGQQLLLITGIKKAPLINVLVPAHGKPVDEQAQFHVRPGDLRPGGPRQIDAVHVMCSFILLGPSYHVGALLRRVVWKESGRLPETAAFSCPASAVVSARFRGCIMVSY